MPGTPVLNMETCQLATMPLTSFVDKVEEDRIENANRDKIDAWCGAITGSFDCVFFSSGAIAGYIANTVKSPFPQPYGGLDIARENRVILEVQCMAVGSGSGGVTRFDVRKQAAAGAVPQSIFNNATFKPILSQSVGSFTVTTTNFFASGSGSWNKGQALMVNVEAAAQDMADVSVIVKWVPSASYTSTPS